MPRKKKCAGFTSRKVAMRNKTREEVPLGKSLAKSQGTAVPDQAGEAEELVLEEKHLQSKSVKKWL